MKTDIRKILDLLEEDDFPYPVAIFPDHDCDLGPITSVNAFDVPAEALLGVSERITELLWPVEMQPMILAGANYDFDSANQRAELPEDTVWYQPRQTHAQSC
ncbi:MAG TPA: hypothetical protein VFD82_17840 [Planctomycetota bacterium]|nr:hypothetical protein [Planctomycetota bacterium]